MTIAYGCSLALETCIGLLPVYFILYEMTLP